ncbi:MAG: pyruvate kinase [Chthoniobacterales bacterium]|nr:pyruvate kinase [Chthoniobacterales bacterium]
MRKTKIICTLGPATEEPDVIRQLIEQGADVFRLNMSHAKHDWVRTIVPQIRQIAAELDRAVAILLDTQGPAIRTGDLGRDLQLCPGDTLEFTVHGAKSAEAYSVDVNYDGLINDISAGDTVLVDNGVIQLLVLEKQHNRIRCKVLTPGTLGSRRHINLPGVRVNLPPLTQKDLADVRVGVDVGVDFVALSFARQKSDVEELRRVLVTLESSAHIVAKIEDQSAVREIDSMIEAADAIMVARGDLGIECPMEELPIIQRRIVKQCLRFGKPVIVATHMLESMIENPVPTRAEITDVANAVFEQADAIMLSGETTVGRYPVKCVEVFDRVACRIERSGGAGFAERVKLHDARQKTVASAVSLADSLPNSKLIVFTRHGTMARYVSNMRPEHSPIFAFTPFEHIYRHLALTWGTHPVLLEFTDDPNTTIEAAEEYLRNAGLTEPNNSLIVISDLRAGDAQIDSIQVRQARGTGAEAVAPAIDEESLMD